MLYRKSNSIIEPFPDFFIHLSEKINLKNVEDKLECMVLLD